MYAEAPTKSTLWTYAEESPGSARFGLPLTITQRMTNSSIESVQTFTYNDEGQITRSVATDGAVTEYGYYSRAGGTGLDVKSVADEDIQALASLSCPAVPTTRALPLKYEYHYQTVAGVELPLHLSAYGYTARKANARDLLDATQVQSLTGVKLDTQSATLSLAAGRSAALIQQMISSVEGKKTIGNSTSWSETVKVNTWWGKARTRQDTKVGYSYGLTDHLVLTTRVETEGGTVEAAKVEQRSRSTGRVIQVQEGAATTHYRYDALGRIIRKEYLRTHESPELAITSYEVDKNGERVTVDTGSQRVRTTYDGLQREVRVEVARGRTGGFYHVSSTEYDELSEVSEQVDYDYLPGGLRRATQQGSRRSLEGLDPILSTSKANPLDKGLETERLILSAKGVALCQKSSRVQLDSGEIKETEHQWLIDRPQLVRETSRSYDLLGRLTSMSQDPRQMEYNESTGIITAPSNPVTASIVYDDLDRPVEVTTSSGVKITRTYHGLSNLVSELKVNGVTVGKQECESPARLLKRVVGERAYGVNELNGNTQLTLPDTKVINVRAVKGKQQLVVGGVAQSTHSMDRGKRIYEAATESINAVAAVAASEGVAAIPGVEAVEGISTTFEGALPLGINVLTHRSPRSRAVASAALSLCNEHLAGKQLTGMHRRVFRDRRDNVVRVIHDHLDHRFRYDAAGHLIRHTTKDGKTGDRMMLTLTWDGFGQETRREYAYNAQQWVIEQTYAPNGQLQTKKLFKDGTLLRTEGYEYQHQTERLTTYTCTAKDTYCPLDSSGGLIKVQAYEYDSLGNLLSRTTTRTDKTVHKHTYTYDSKNPTRRLTAKHQAGDANETSVTLTYDANGNQTTDEQGRVMTYTPLGQLASVSDASGKVLATYGYDGFQRLAVVRDAAKNVTYELLYDGDRLIGELWYAADNLLVNRVTFGDGIERHVRLTDEFTAFTMLDSYSGVFATVQTGQSVGVRSVSPYGEGFTSTRLGFNGQWRDPVLGWYHMGNGYRAYNPAQGHWLQPDSWSPFGAGGINDTAYCNGDPVNLHDPSGHIMISRWGQNQMLNNLEQVLRETQPTPLGHFWRGLATTVAFGAVALALSIPTGGASLAVGAAIFGAALVSTGLEIASYLTAESNPKLSQRLGYGALAVGLIGFNPIKAAQGIGRLLRLGTSKVGRLVKNFIEARARLLTMRRVKAVVRRPGLARRYQEVTMGRTESYTVLDDEIHMSTDTYKGKKRIVFEMHGVDKGGKSAISYHGAEMNVDSFLQYLKNKGVKISDYENIKLMMCHSADGGVDSFAQELSRKTMRPVKGYKGEIDMAHLQEWYNEDLKISKELADARRGVDYVGAIKVEQAPMSANQWIQHRKFNPVKFTPYGMPSRVKQLGPERLAKEGVRRQAELAIKKADMARWQLESAVQEITQDLSDLL